jgi:hypothetical protein
MRFVDTIRPLLIAPAAAVLVAALAEVFDQKSGRIGVSFMIVLAWIWVLSLAAAVVFVLPVFAFVSRLREPPLWFAALWGALLAGISSALVIGPSQFMRTSRGAHLGLALSGAAAGLFYAVLVRRRSGERSGDDATREQEMGAR